MNIQIDSKYSLRSDQDQYILMEHKIAGDNSKEPGKEYTVNAGYYVRLKSALNAYLDKKIKGSNATTINELLEDVHKARKCIEQFCYYVIEQNKVVDNDLKS